MVKSEHVSAAGERGRVTQSTISEPGAPRLRVDRRDIVPTIFDGEISGLVTTVPGATKQEPPQLSGMLLSREQVSVVNASAGTAGADEHGSIWLTQDHIGITADAGGSGIGGDGMSTENGEADEGDNSFRINVGTPEPGQRVASPSAVVMIETPHSFVLEGRPASEGHLAHSGKWGFFGGHAEPGEDQSITAPRELGEEIGLESEGPLNFLWRGDYHNSQDRAGQRVTQNVSLFQTEIPSIEGLNMQVGGRIVEIPKTKEAIEENREHMTDFTYQALRERLRLQTETAEHTRSNPVRHETVGEGDGTRTQEGMIGERRRKAELRAEALELQTTDLSDALTYVQDTLGITVPDDKIPALVVHTRENKDRMHQLIEEEKVKAKHDTVDDAFAAWVDREHNIIFMGQEAYAHPERVIHEVGHPVIDYLNPDLPEAYARHNQAVAMLGTEEKPPTIDAEESVIAMVIHEGVATWLGINSIDSQEYRQDEQNLKLNGDFQDGEVIISEEWIDQAFDNLNESVALTHRAIETNTRADAVQANVLARDARYVAGYFLVYSMMEKLKSEGATEEEMQRMLVGLIQHPPTTLVDCRQPVAYGYIENLKDTIRAEEVGSPKGAGKELTRNEATEASNTRPEKYHWEIDGPPRSGAAMSELRVRLYGITGRKRSELSRLELPLDEQRREQLRDMNGALLRFASDELGLDLTNTVPEINSHFHFFDAATYQQVSSLGEAPEGSYEGETTSYGDILVPEQSSLRNTLASTNHELMHACATRLVRVIGDNIEVIPMEYEIPKTRGFRTFSEIMTSLTDMEIRGRYWGDYESLAHVNNGNMGYHEGVMVVEALLKKIASSKGKEYKEVLRDFQRGRFLGQKDHFQEIADVFSHTGIRILSSWQEHTADEALRVAQELGLEDAIRKLEAFARGEKVSMLQNIVPGFALISSKPKS